MRTCFLLSTIGLLGAFIVFACTPTTSTPSAPTETLSVPTATATQTMIVQLTNSLPSATVQVVATSRGPNLEATDPTTVSLASGGLQLVEFFRFT